MTTVELRHVHPQDEGMLRSWWEVGRAASAERPFEAWPSWDAFRARARVHRTDGRGSWTVALLADRVVGASRLWFFDLDNTHLAELEVYVAPEVRRRGIGRALVEDAEERTRRDSRTTILASVFAPVDAESPGSLFAGRCGYDVGSHEETKLLDIARAPAGWPRLEAEVASAIGDYRVEVAVEAMPETYIEDFSTLLSAFVGEVPTGDLDLEERPQWTPERIRDAEDRLEREGTMTLYGVAVAPDGHLCGFTDLRVQRDDPRHARVGATLVMPGHRGHRLALAMKLATHRRLAELFPECEQVETGNAGVNAAMNAINHEMGYRVVERCLDVQKRLSS